MRCEKINLQKESNNYLPDKGSSLSCLGSFNFSYFWVWKLLIKSTWWSVCPSTVLWITNLCLSNNYLLLKQFLFSIFLFSFSHLVFFHLISHIILFHFQLFVTGWHVFLLRVFLFSYSIFCLLIKDLIFFQICLKSKFVSYVIFNVLSFSSIEN